MTPSHAVAIERPSIPPLAGRGRPAIPAAVEVSELSRRFETTIALERVSLRVEAGEIHALLGPNGAGKTTLLRILAGLLTPSEGAVYVNGTSTAGSPRALRALIGLIPAGDRSFYLRLTGLENLAFFARLQGFSKKGAFAKAEDTLAAVGLADAARTRVGVYSHGMQKRLSVARALLTDPKVLLVDEATHDLDPEGGRRIRSLVAELAAGRAAVVWATQRLDEVRGFAARVTLLREGRTCFSGTVPELMEHSVPRRFLLRLRNGHESGGLLDEALRRALGSLATIEGAGGQSEHYLLSLQEGAVLGDALGALMGARFEILACRQERSEIEDAFVTLTGRLDS
jgi:ABC-type multidrug transport system ATPase subunit